MAEREQLPRNGMAELRESTATPSRTPGVLSAVAVDSLNYEYWWSCVTVSEAFLRVVETQFYIIKNKILEHLIWLSKYVFISKKTRRKNSSRVCWRPVTNYLFFTLQNIKVTIVLLTKYIICFNFLTYVLNLRYWRTHVITCWWLWIENLRQLYYNTK